jgi:hypothetical protein
MRLLGWMFLAGLAVAIVAVTLETSVGLEPPVSTVLAIVAVVGGIAWFAWRAGTAEEKVE